LNPQRVLEHTPSGTPTMDDDEALLSDILR
jgi:hypothetical protein